MLCKIHWTHNFIGSQNKKVIENRQGSTDCSNLSETHKLRLGLAWIDIAMSMFVLVSYTVICQILTWGTALNKYGLVDTTVSYSESCIKILKLNMGRLKVVSLSQHAYGQGMVIHICFCGLSRWGMILICGCLGETVKCAQSWFQITNYSLHIQD